MKKKSLFDSIPLDRESAIPVVIFRGEQNKLTIRAGSNGEKISDVFDALKADLRQKMVRAFSTAGSTYIKIDPAKDTLHISGHHVDLGQANTDEITDLIRQEIGKLDSGTLKNKLFGMLSNARFTGSTKDAADVKRHTLG